MQLKSEVDPKLLEPPPLGQESPQSLLILSVLLFKVYWEGLEIRSRARKGKRAFPEQRSESRREHSVKNKSQVEFSGPQAAIAENLSKNEKLAVA